MFSHLRLQYQREENPKARIQKRKIFWSEKKYEKDESWGKEKERENVKDIYREREDNRRTEREIKWERERARGKSKEIENGRQKEREEEYERVREREKEERN